MSWRPASTSRQLPPHPYRPHSTQPGCPPPRASDATSSKPKRRRLRLGRGRSPVRPTTRLLPYRRSRRPSPERRRSPGRGTSSSTAASSTPPTTSTAGSVPSRSSRMTARPCAVRCSPTPWQAAPTSTGRAFRVCRSLLRAVSRRCRRLMATGSCSNSGRAATRQAQPPSGISCSAGRALITPTPTATPPERCRGLSSRSTCSS